MKIEGTEPLSALERQARREEVAEASANAAERIFDIFNRWLDGTPGGAIEIKANSPYVSKRFEVTVRAPLRGEQIFKGESAQDVCAQAAQTLFFNGENET